MVRQFALTPVGADFFAGEADDLSRAYRDLPVLDPTLIPLWTELGGIVTEQSDQLRKQYRVVTVDYDPYQSEAEIYTAQRAQRSGIGIE